MKKHLKLHIMFYLGLAQLVAGWASAIDFQRINVPAAILAASGLLTLISKYVQTNLPDDAVPFPTTPALSPAQPGEAK